ncbi:hypothetical protein D0863_00312 [Hortaea werneckii]|uniref:Rhodopsin domain-containing protein n=1 Tax=Hortaea werneckii TaxID=91943 RepID=A0A3M7EQZ3_HORWE|nr:hypothetical protein D0863_00312 [Hortaea werneckii]
MGAGHAPGQAVTGATVAFTVLAGLATIMRLFTRLHIVHTAGIDDVSIIIAMCLSIVLTATMVKQVTYGIGDHYDDLNHADQIHVLQWMWASIWVYYLALGAAKCSIILQYLRIFPHNKFRLACYILLAVIGVYTAWTFFSSLLACIPVASFWDKSIEGHCLARLPVWFTNAALNIVTDIATVVIPLPVLKGLQLPKRQKIALMIVFGLGGITCIVSILRLQSLYAISIAEDVTWENPMAAIWSSIEVNVGILCSCIPTLKGCVNRVFPRFFKDRSTGRPSVPDNIELTPGGAGKHFAMASRNHDSKPRGRATQGGREADEGIQVVTVMEQEVEDRSRREDDSSSAESESVRKLVLQRPGNDT